MSLVHEEIKPMKKNLSLWQMCLLPDLLALSVVWPLNRSMTSGSVHAPETLHNCVHNRVTLQYDCLQ